MRVNLSFQYVAMLWLCSHGGAVEHLTFKNLVTFPDEIRLNILRILEDEPSISQRQLAKRLGISLGKVNYCLRALTEKGWVKVNNFKENPHKRSYLYLLTPGGIEKKAELATRFLKAKIVEYDALKREIELLNQEVNSGTRRVECDIDQ